MAIRCYENVSEAVKKLIKIDTKKTSYVIGAVDEEMFLGHIYYGAYSAHSGTPFYSFIA